MTTIALFILSAVAALCVALFHRNRAKNLERLTCDLHDQLAEACATLDDAVRLCEHLRHLHDSLLSENTTLITDLMHTETRCQYLESLHRQRKGETAGALITEFYINPKRKLLVHTGEMP